MPTYSYRVLTSDGTTRGGVGRAGSPSELERRLREEGVYPLEVTAASEGTETDDGRHRTARRGKRAAVTRFFRYLSTLVGAGVPLDRAVAIGARATSRDDLAEALEEVRARVREGGGLAEAFGEHPDLFPPVAMGVTRAGERGGGLDEAFDRLAASLERTGKLAARLRTALVYPAAMAVVGGVSLAVLLFWVLPRFTEMIRGMGMELPLSTSLLLGATEFAGTWWPAMVAGAAGVGVAAWRFLRTDRGEDAVHRLLLRLPLVAPLRRQLVAVRTGRTLSALLARGLPMLEALEVTEEALGDRVARAELARARGEVRTGRSLHRALRDGRAFPEPFLQMVEVGEEGGRLVELVRHGADVMEDDVEQGLERVVRMAEPAMILVFGAAVGFVVK